jgi:hypothetical protein
VTKPPFFAERSKITRAASDELEQEADLPPIVARMVVEIRSDGSRTIARGALEDLQNGERIALQADAASPVALAAQLTKALVQMPSMARTLTEGAAREFSQAQLAKLSKLKDKLGPLSELSPFKKKKKD